MKRKYSALNWLRLCRYRTFCLRTQRSIGAGIFTTELGFVTLPPASHSATDIKHEVNYLLLIVYLLFIYYLFPLSRSIQPGHPSKANIWLLAQMYKSYKLYFPILLPVVIAVLPTVLSCVAVVCLLYYRILCHFRSGLSATNKRTYCIVLYCIALKHFARPRAAWGLDVDTCKIIHKTVARFFFANTVALHIKRFWTPRY